MDEAPTDLLLEILRRVPPASRRRLRLVCRHWRDAVDGSPELHTRGKPLLWVDHDGRSKAYAIDEEGRSTKVWTGKRRVAMVGTCNGLLCLCDNAKPGGAITVVNPATGEKLAVPPFPPGGENSRHGAYAFACDHSTGRHKIVHVPSYSGMVRVFTLGEPSWRDVPAPGMSCSFRSGGLVGVDGAAHWMSKDRKKLMSFDVRGERLAAKSFPVSSSRGYEFQLMVVQGRLGVAISRKPAPRNANTEVWVLQERRRWRHRYDVPLQALGLEKLTGPLFAHGERLLTALQPREFRDRSVLYGHKIGEEGRQVVASLKGRITSIFAYIETTEPLSGLVAREVVRIAQLVITPILDDVVLPRSANSEV